MKKMKAAVAVLIALASVSIISVSAFAHHGGGHHGAYRNVNYCAHVDADNNGICDNCSYACGGYSNCGHHMRCWY